MSVKKSHRGLKALEKNEKQVMYTIRNHLYDIAIFLRNEDLVDREYCNHATDPTNRDPPEDKARLLLKHLKNTIQNSGDDKYHMFVNFIRTLPNTTVTCTELDKTYADLQEDDVTKKDDADKDIATSSVPVPKKFSEEFSPEQFAQWLRSKYGFSSDDCDRIIKNRLSGMAFTALTDKDLNEVFGFEGAGYFTLKALLKKLTQPTSGHVPDAESKIVTDSDDKDGADEEKAHTSAASGDESTLSTLNKILDESTYSTLRGTLSQLKKYSNLSSSVMAFKTDYVSAATMTTDQKNKFTVAQMDLLNSDVQKIKGKGAKIAIIDLIGPLGDKGFHFWHSAFNGKITKDDVQCFSEFNARRPDAHATVCAGIAVGKPFMGNIIENGINVNYYYHGGVAPEATAKIFLIDGWCGFVEALKKIEKENFDVISISLGYEGNYEGSNVHDYIRNNFMQIREKLNHLSDSTLIVVSAGNLGPVKGVLFPANLDSVISVGCLGEFGQKMEYAPNLVSIFCYGEVCAPASDASNALLQWATGTSMAAPAIAGLICLFIQCANEGIYLSNADKKDVLYRMKKKENMMRILDKTKNAEYQIKPAALLKEASNARNFKQWFDEITK